MQAALTYRNTSEVTLIPQFCPCYQKESLNLKAMKTLSDVELAFEAKRETQPSLDVESKFFISDTLKIKGAVVDV